MITRACLRVPLLGFAILTAVGGVRAQSPPPARVLVMPFENTTREASIFWLSEGSAVLLADDLDALKVQVIGREERQRALTRLQVRGAATLTDATVIRIGRLVGAAEVVMGSLQLEGDILVARARVISLEAGRVSRDIEDRGPMIEMFSTFDRIARQIAPPGRKVDGERRQPPLAAFESYVKGLLAETSAIGVKYLNAALAAMPTFDRARLALWEVYTEQGEHTRALAAVQPVRADSSWSSRARFLSALSYLNLKRNDEAFAVFKALADAQPSAASLNNLGVVELRRSGIAPGRAAYFFN